MVRQSSFLNWQSAGGAAAAVFIFFLTLFGLARYVDNTALAREKSQLQNALDVAVKELAKRITAISDWDDAVAHLDRSFDAAWAKSNVGAYFVQNDSLPVSFVLDAAGRPVLAMLDGRSAALESYRPFSSAAVPLLARVRAEERRRGPFRPPFHAAGDIARPIQAAGFALIDNVPYVVFTSLVQPDMGNVLPRDTRSAVLVNAKPLEGEFLQAIGTGLLMPHLTFSTRVRFKAAGVTVRDVRGTVVGTLTWEPWTPGADLILFAFLPILAGVAVPLGLYLRSRVMSEKLGRALHELSEARDHADAARKAAQESDHAKSKFLANMSHELRTPLNAILGFSEMLKSETFRHATEEYAGIIHRTAQFLLSLINDILDMSKIDAGKVVLVESDVDLSELAEDCISMMLPKAEANRLVLRTELPKELPRLRCDDRCVRQILLNLLSNAAKFTDPGGEIVVRANVLGTGEMCIAVADTGRGIAVEDQTRVFESFGQGRHDIVCKDQGTGLGLPIVRGLTEAHDGWVTLVSSVGEGTCVSLFFPADRVLYHEREKCAA